MVNEYYDDDDDYGDDDYDDDYDGVGVLTGAR
jgi:hypothetical protein